ncbi:MAG: hypothetical protein AAB303_03930 [Chloroflexota bacterium]
MKASSRGLIVMVAVVGVLAIAALVVGLVAAGKEKVLSEDSPEGVVQGFLRAVQAGDYKKAYDYFGSKLKTNCAYERFLEQRPGGQIEEMQATLAGTKTFDGQAEVKIVVTQFRTSGPFFAPFDSPANSYPQTYILGQEDGKWRFASMPWPLYWCPGPEPVKPAL